MTAGIIRVGISGWTYAPWRGVFYPAGLKRQHELDYAARRMSAAEINETFYTQHRPEDFASWAAQVPAHFVFAVKAPRAITHIRRLKDVAVPLANFIASGLLRLDIHLGPILWQLPPNFRFDPVGIEAFLRLLPHDRHGAVALGRLHDQALRGPAALVPGANRPLRHALEVRHESFRCHDFIALLRKYNVAVVCADSDKWPRLMDVTADFVYCRLLGSKAPHPNGYDGEALDEWATRIKSWARGDDAAADECIGGRAGRRKRDVFVFFDNDMKVSAPANAVDLIRRLRT